MSTGKLPDPAAPGPIAGQPGHFAHHDWLEGAVTALNERLLAQWKQGTGTSVPTATWTLIGATTVLLDTGLDVVAAGGAGTYTLGAGAPEGIYMVHAVIQWQNDPTGTRRHRVAVNNVNFPTLQTIAAANSGSGVYTDSHSYVLLKPGDVLKWEGYQNSGTTGTTGTDTNFSMEYLGALPPVSS